MTMELTCSSETSVLTRATLYKAPEDIFQLRVALIKCFAAWTEVKTISQETTVLYTKQYSNQSWPKEYNS
jgi:CHAD domain-containing protein